MPGPSVPDGKDIIRIFAISYIGFVMGWIFRNLREFDRFLNRKRLRNTSFSLITNNCIGGVISHDLGLQFRSPTINLYFTYEDFILFCQHLRYYLSLPVEEVESEMDYPVGALKGEYGTVRIYFQHYGSFGQAKEKWERRASRVDFDNLYVMMESKKCSQTILEQFDHLDLPNKVVLTDGPHPEIRSSFPILGDFYGKKYDIGYKLMTYPKNRLRRYMDVFDYVAFFNRGVIRRRLLI